MSEQGLDTGKIRGGFCGWQERRRSKTPGWTIYPERIGKDLVCVGFAATANTLRRRDEADDHGNSTLGYEVGL